MRIKELISLGKHATRWGLFILLGVVPGSSQAFTIALSTEATETLGGATVNRDQAASYNTATNTAAVFFNPWPSTSPQLDGFHILPSGHYLISTGAGTTLGGLTFENGDIVEYDPVADTASLFFDEDLFSSDANVDAISMMPDGRLVLSTVEQETLGGLILKDGDIVAYNKLTDVATKIFDETVITSGHEVDGVHVLADGRILISTGAGSTIGGVSYKNGDVILWDPVTQTASVLLDEDVILASDGNIDAIAGIDMTEIEGVLPEPSATLLLAVAGLLGLAARRRAHG